MTRIDGSARWIGIVALIIGLGVLSSIWFSTRITNEKEEFDSVEAVTPAPPEPQPRIQKTLRRLDQGRRVETSFE
ncbi:hypothetical protein JW905_05025, partial [bacterium]|nr:hypothetical protein [candidate division CSSED10-310 bacterium]